MPLGASFAAAGAAVATTALTAVTTCLGEDGGLQCCTADSDKWTVGDLVKGRLILSVVACTAVGVTYLITSNAKKIKDVAGRAFDAVSELKKTLTGEKGIDVEVLPNPEAK